jgi:DNA-binding GntR family transcriptional regulator
MARYQEIADDIRTKIKDGTYPVGGKLPTISQLQQEYGDAEGNPALNTIRAAQQVLAEEGMVEARHGIGVFVTATESTREIDVPAAVAAARDTLTAVLGALAVKAKRSITFDLDDKDNTKYFVLGEALREFAARERWQAEDNGDGNAADRLRWAEVADAMAEQVDQV